MTVMRVCYVCLARDAECKLFNINSYNLQEAYEWLSGADSALSENALICSRCAALLKKCVNLRDMCRSSHVLLLQCTQQRDSTLKNLIKNDFIINLKPVDKEKLFYIKIKKRKCKNSSVKPKSTEYLSSLNILHVQVPGKHKPTSDSPEVKINSDNEETTKTSEICFKKEEQFDNLAESDSFSKLITRNSEISKFETDDLIKDIKQENTSCDDFDSTEIVSNFDNKIKKKKRHKKTKKKEENLACSKEKVVSKRKTAIRNKDNLISEHETAIYCEASINKNKKNVVSRKTNPHSKQSDKTDSNGGNIFDKKHINLTTLNNINPSEKISINASVTDSTAKGVISSAENVIPNAETTSFTKFKAISNKDEHADERTFIQMSLMTQEEQAEQIQLRLKSSNYKNALFKCKFCYKGFMDKSAFKNHCINHVESTGQFECDICRNRYAVLSSLRKHIKANHMNKYSCTKCPYVCYNRTQARVHYRWHKGVTYKCPHCDDVSTKWTSHLSHVRLKHPSSFVCGICANTFVSAAGLARHKHIVHKAGLENGLKGIGPYCVECKVQFESQQAYVKHVLITAVHSDKEKYKNGCRHCGELCLNESTLRTHLRTHSRIKHTRVNVNAAGDGPIEWPHKCALCDDVLENGLLYWGHFRSKHPDREYPTKKLFVCEVCGKAFTSNTTLQYHTRSHTGEKPFKCTQCDKEFHQKLNLSNHLRSHSEARPHACASCGKGFKFKAALDRHMRVHTGERPYACPLCGKCFTESGSRKLHVRTVHYKEPQPYLSKRRQERKRQLEQARALPFH